MRSLHDNGLTESDNEPMYPDTLPCPFCGVEAWFDCDMADESKVYVYCPNSACPIEDIRTESFETMEEAATAWNTRHGATP